MELREKVLTLPINDEEDIVKLGGGGEWKQRKNSQLKLCMIR
jgi:hypothetical protein